MKKLLQKIIAISLITLFFITTASYAATDSDYVRVRVRTPRLFNEQAALQGYEDITVYALNGQPNELFKLEESEINVLLDSYFDGNFNFVGNEGKAYYGPHHVVLDKEFSSYKEANKVVKELEEKFNGDFYPYYGNDSYKIYAGYYTEKNKGKDLLEKLSSSGYNGDLVSTNMKNVIVYDKFNNAIFMYSNELDIYFSSYKDDEYIQSIKIDGKPFRGYISFKIIENAKLISINYVDLESYLYGVVPNEIAASWGMEALKAQAIAARTYAVSCLNPYASNGYELEDNQNSQVYRGVVSEKESTNEAVDATKGEMIYYNNKLIQAVYHSTSGGSTENSENVWYAKLPYLVGVNDDYSDRSGSPHNVWNADYKKEDIIKRLKLDGNDVSELYSMEITKVSENNRVLECIFLTDIGEIVYEKENLRLLLGLKSSLFTVENGSVFYFTNENTYNKNSTEEIIIPSRSGILDSIAGNSQDDEDIQGNKLDSGNVNGKYVITSSGTKKINEKEVAVICSEGTSVLDTNRNTSDYSFSGKGWGHGIGMSQYGAKQMAQEGFTYEEILKHYYTGVTIK